MNYIYIIIAVSTLIFLSILILVYRSGRSRGSREGRAIEGEEKNGAYFKEILSRDGEIRNLRRKIDELDNLNSQYLAFMFKVPSVIQRLNSMLKLEEIVESLTILIKDIIPTNLVHLYLCRSDGTLKRVDAEKTSGNGEDDLHNNEMELIEAAAQNRIVRISGQMDTSTATTNGPNLSKSEIWMAVPIILREKLVGVIGIGKIAQPVGNETNLMKMIADIAAVTLVNQATLGEAKQQANTDPLTGISNRNSFAQMGQTFVEKAIRENSQISIFLFDIDHFKHYNDTNGHDAGDRLLIDLTTLVGSITRKNAVFARYGGEEFIVMLPGISKEDALIYAERVREKISQHQFFNREGQPLGCVSISGGVAGFPVDGDTLSKTIQIADKSLYEAKAGGRNRVIAHKPQFFSYAPTDDKREYSEIQNIQKSEQLSRK